jgi:mycoredoxin
MDEMIKLYGTTWCGGTRRARRILDDNKIPYQWIDIDQDKAAQTFLEQINNGFRSVPTLIFPDGSKIVEPSDAELADRLGVPRPSSFF